MLKIKKRWKKEQKEKEKREKRALRGGKPALPSKGTFYKKFKIGEKSIRIERLNRVRFSRVEVYIMFLKLIINTSYIENQPKALASFYLSSLSKRVSLSRHKNVCLITGHRRSVYTFVRLNRLTARERINNLEFPGTTIAKW